MKARHTGASAPVHSRVAAFSATAAFPLSKATRLLLAAVPAFASGGAFAQAADAPAQEVVVTAARVEQKLPDTLPATTVISRHDIESSPASDLPDLLRTLTSFNVAQTGPTGSATSVFVRGANSNQVLVLIDGAPISRADLGSSPWELIPLDQIDHVEIVRGNLSSLYGAAAVGGVVQIFTKSGGGTSVSLAAGSHGRMLGSVSFGRRLGDAATPLDISASVSGQTTDGYNATNPATNPSANPDRDPSHQTGENVRVGKTWAPGQRTEFSLLHSETSSAYDGFAGTPGQDTLSTSLDGYTLQTHHALTPSLKLNASVGETMLRYQDPTGYTPRGTADTRLIGADIDWSVVQGHSLQLGVEGKNEQYKDTNTASERRETKSVRAGYVGNFASVIDVQANVRHDDADDFGTANTGLLALGWRISPAWKVVAQASNAFSVPVFSDQPYAAPGVTLKPEHSRDIELGVHWTGGGWLARATWFSQRQHDLLDFGALGVTNVGHASNHGIELAADGTLGPGTLGIDATFQDPRNGDTDSQLARRARTNAAVNYRLPIMGWDTGLWLRYTGKRPDTDPVTFGTVEAPKRTVLGLTTQHAVSQNWTLGLKIDNLTNTAAAEVVGYAAQPREVLVTLRGQWQ